MTHQDLEALIQRERGGKPALAAATVTADPHLPPQNGRKRASFYADPVSWLVLEAAEQAIAAFGDDLTPWADRVGVITVSDFCTIITMRKIQSAIAKGVVSPLMFSGANPAAVGSLPSHMFGFTGPTLVLSMPVADGVRTATTLASAWLDARTAKYIILNLHWVTDDQHNVSSLLLG